MELFYISLVVAIIVTILFESINGKRQRTLSLKYMVEAASIGGITEDENKCIEKVCKKYKVSPEKFIELCKNPNKRVKLPDYPGERIKILRDIVDVIKADDVISPEEESLLHIIAKKLELPDEKASKLIDKK